MTPGSFATYICDDGYELFGEARRVCSPDGTWKGEVPFCAINVASGKPANQSSTSRGGKPENANDGDTTIYHEDKFCTETKQGNSPWWQVDLLQGYEVRVVRIFTRGCCGHQPLHNLEIRVGNSSVIQENRLCAWYPGTIEDGTTKDFECAYPINGRYVYVQMVGIEGSLSLCEVMVFSTQEFSAQRCGNHLESLKLTTFSHTCYEFQGGKGGTFGDADRSCQEHGGWIVQSISNVTHRFLSSELERLKDKLKSKLVWFGAQREPGVVSQKWHWVNNQAVVDFLWAPDQPNNYNGQQNCVVLDGGRKWMWNDVTCDLDYLPWICQYSPSNCGSPDRKENSTILGNNFTVGQQVTYICPVGNMLVGEATRTCDTNGFWTGVTPSCKYVDCGPLLDTDYGKVRYLEARTTFNASAQYTCDQNYTLTGDAIHVCLGSGNWKGDKVKCLLNQCPQLKTPANSILEVTGHSAGSHAKYSCEKGYRLIGKETRNCELGGMWTDSEPQCKFIDCGMPDPLTNGDHVLLNQTTTYLNKVKYTCHRNFSLVGDEVRTCLETKLWSGKQPVCKLIECREPDVQPGSYVEGDGLTVHSVIDYFCETGHVMISTSSRRVCGLNGRWSGEAPVCHFINCGRVPPIPRGVVHYVNETTFLHSIISYDCSFGFRLIGDRVRLCLEDGHWSGSTPLCEEIRCPVPQVPPNASVIYTGNDRPLAVSFKIGSNAQYRCIEGHVLKGVSLRRCLQTGVWSGEVPLCGYIECGLPMPVGHGHWLLSNNATFYGASVEYKCDENYEIVGPSRRLCSENGTWSRQDPQCIEISCGVPNTLDTMTVIEGSVFTIGRMVVYSCIEGYKVTGQHIRSCLKSGQWSGQTPFCTLVDCGQPTIVTNGRGFLMNGTTTYEAMVEYKCLPGFKMVGDPVRHCLSSGNWSGQEPICINIPPTLDPSENLVNGEFSDSQLDSDRSKTVGIAVAVGIGAFLVLVVIIVVICIKTKKARPVKNTENVPVHIPREKEASVLSYSNFCMETGSQENPDSLGENAFIRHNPNGLVTFSANPQPIYANITFEEQTSSPSASGNDETAAVASTNNI
ncbi:CUB and sushi domain-containing protein 1-like [Tachypleus tridentatus]|uniref:CUB and sushi domain-containing protein 1-like n=1 Tax=Tachypleus tridentatus TaxID=6853 RepID=UPI003FD2B619